MPAQSSAHLHFDEELGFSVHKIFVYLIYRKTQEMFIQIQSPASMLAAAERIKGTLSCFVYFNIFSFFCSDVTLAYKHLFDFTVRR